MKSVTFRLDEPTYDLLEALKKAGFNKSEVLRESLHIGLKTYLEE